MRHNTSQLPACSCCSCRLTAAIDRLIGQVASQDLARDRETPAAAPMPKALLPLNEAAEQLNCSEVFLRRMISRGELRAVRLGAKRLVKIPASEIERVAAGSSIEGQNLPLKEGCLPIGPRKLTRNQAL